MRDQLGNVFILAAVATLGLALFKRRARASKPFVQAPSGPVLGGFTGGAPPKEPTPPGTIKKGKTPGPVGPSVVPVETGDASTYLQPIGSCELGSGIPGTLYLNQFGEEVCA